MLSTLFSKRPTRGLVVRSIVATVCFAGIAGLFACAAASAQDADSPIPEEGEIHNLTNKPFSFQLHRADGAAWTEAYTIPPGKYFAVKVPKAGQTTEIQGITGNGRGFVIIRHPEPVLGGYLTVRLPAQNPNSGKIQPTWFAVQDSNGITRLLQEPNVETAKAAQDALKKQPKMTAQELERSKHMLRANWVLTDSVPTQR